MDSRNTRRQHYFEQITFINQLGFGFQEANCYNDKQLWGYTPQFRLVRTCHYQVRSLSSSIVPLRPASFRSAASRIRIFAAEPQELEVYLRISQQTIIPSLKRPEKPRKGRYSVSKLGPKSAEDQIVPVHLSEATRHITAMQLQSCIESYVKFSSEDTKDGDDSSLKAISYTMAWRCWCKN